MLTSREDCRPLTWRCLPGRSFKTRRRGESILSSGHLHANDSYDIRSKLFLISGVLLDLFEKSGKLTEESEERRFTQRTLDRNYVNKCLLRELHEVWVSTFTYNLTVLPGSHSMGGEQISPKTGNQVRLEWLWLVFKWFDPGTESTTNF